MHRVLESCGIVRVQTWDVGADAPAGVEAALGVAWPREVGAVVASGADIEVLCPGPTDWWVVAGAEAMEHGVLLERLRGACEGSAFRATDLSQAFGRVEIAGAESRMLLAKGCALDLDASRFASGRCARTRFAGMAVMLQCVREFGFRCFVASSHLGYLLSWRDDAEVEAKSASIATARAP